MINLNNAILKEDSSSNLRSIEKLKEYCVQYDLKWISSPKTKSGAYFVMSEVSSSIGYNACNFRKHWTNAAILKRNNKRKENMSPLYGRHFRLHSESLDNFVKNYYLKYNIYLGNKKVLWIGDWKTCLDYIDRNLNKYSCNKKDSLILKQFVSPSAQKLQSKIVIPPIKTNNCFSEADIHSCLVELLSYSNYHFKQEDAVNNLLVCKDNCKSRRFDLTLFKPALEQPRVEIYEIKKDQININHVSSTLGEKGYLNLAKNKYKNKSVKLIFLSPKGITEDASRLISCMEDISFIKLSEFVESVLNFIKLDYNVNASQGLWFYENQILPKFSHLIS
jgi:hypothetical protein